MANIIDKEKPSSHNKFFFEDKVSNPTQKGEIITIPKPKHERKNIRNNFFTYHLPYDILHHILLLCVFNIGNELLVKLIFFYL